MVEYSIEEISIVEHLVKLCKDELQLDILDSQDSLFDLGATSIDLIVLLSKIEDDFEVAMPLSFIDDLTIDSMAKKIYDLKSKKG